MPNVDRVRGRPRIESNGHLGGTWRGEISTAYVVAKVTELTSDAIIQSLRQGNDTLRGMLW